MNTTFNLFTDETKAETAVAELLEVHTFDDINVIVQAKHAKNAITNDSAPKLHHLLQGEQSVALSDVGEVYASGALATTLVRTAAAPGAVDGNLAAALADFGLEQNKANEYQTAIQKGQILLWTKPASE
jgi:hypothetical protein